jgi:uncharacterized protein (DUF885 family)
LTRQIDPQLIRVFRTLPRMPYGVEPIPEKIAPDTTTAYYRQPAADGSRAGTFFVNLYKPEMRPTWEMMALSLHEAVPGHHLQIALAMEQGAVPEFRRHLELTAYVEGWGLYSESLGTKWVFTKIPTASSDNLPMKCGALFASSLIRECTTCIGRVSRRSTFSRPMPPKTDQDIVNEIDRYISWPGQALAYKVGQLKIRELRTRAERELGPKFDLREFHDVVLLSGALPLDILEKRVNDWLHSKRAQ